MTVDHEIAEGRFSSFGSANDIDIVFEPSADFVPNIEKLVLLAVRDEVVLL